MTKRGGLFITITALLLFLSLATGFSEIYFIFFLCMFVILFSILSTIISVYRLEIKQMLSFYSIIQGDNTTLRILMNSTIPLAAYVYIDAVLPPMQKKYITKYNFFSKSFSVDFPVTCKHRGQWDIGIDSVLCGDIFGLFAFPVNSKKIPKNPLAVTVYPIIMEIPGLAHTSPYAIDAENPSKHVDQGDTFSDVRLYRDGDSLKRIHWKLSARTRTLYTRQYEAPAEQTVLIVVDTILLGADSFSTSIGYADMVASAAASLAHHFLLSNFIVSMNATANNSEKNIVSQSSRSVGEFDYIYNMLATVNFDKNSNTHINEIINAVNINFQSLYDARKLFVITRNPDENLLQYLTELCSDRLSVTLVYLEAADKQTETTVTNKGLRLVPIIRPRDISQRLGENS